MSDVLLISSEETDGSVPNTLVIANCEVFKKRVAAGDHIAHFNEESCSSFVKKYKTIIHPGEVNRIRELPQNNSIIATHTDCPEATPKLSEDKVKQCVDTRLNGEYPLR